MTIVSVSVTAESGKNGVPAVQIAGDKHFPDHEYSQGEGQQGAQTGAPAKQHEEGGKAGEQKQLLVQPVVIDEGNRAYCAVRMTDNGRDPISGDEYFVEFQRSVEHVYTLDDAPAEASVKNIQSAALFAGAYQAAVHDSAVVRVQNEGQAAFCAFVLEKIFISRGQNEQDDDDDEAGKNRKLMAQPSRRKKEGTCMKTPVGAVSD